MTTPAMPMAAQIRAMAADSVRSLRRALNAAGLIVKPGGAHQRVEIGDGVRVGTLPYTPSDYRNLRSTRSDLARRIEEIRASYRKTNHQERS